MTHQPEEPGRIVALGEALVDLVADSPGEGSLADAATFYRAAGGAPANVAVGVARLGARSGFVGAVGNDAFGDFLETTLREEGVDTSQMIRSEQERTALAFVSLGAGGEREFLFYRHATADLQLRPSDLSEDYVSSAAVLHVGSLSLTAEPVRSATLAALQIARGSGVERSVDPNLRLDLWPDPETARRQIRELLAHATLLKISEDELEFLTGASGEGAARSLMHPDLALVCVTRGAAGVDYYTRSTSGTVATYKVQPVDTTGAGDAFMAALLVGLHRTPLMAQGLADDVNDTQTLEKILRRANAFAALTVTRLGAIPAMPTAKELEAFLAANEAHDQGRA